MTNIANGGLSNVRNQFSHLADSSGNSEYSVRAKSYNARYAVYVLKQWIGKSPRVVAGIARQKKSMDGCTVCPKGGRYFFRHKTTG